YDVVVRQNVALGVKNDAGPHALGNLGLLVEAVDRYLLVGDLNYPRTELRGDVGDHAGATSGERKRVRRRGEDVADRRGRGGRRGGGRGLRRGDRASRGRRDGHTGRRPGRGCRSARRRRWSRRWRRGDGRGAD